jgi:hypothetical protein
METNLESKRLFETHADSPRAIKAYPELVEAHPGAVETHLGGVETCLGVVDTHPGVMEAPGVKRLISKTWRISLEPLTLTLKPWRLVLDHFH